MEGDPVAATVRLNAIISIHALLAEATVEPGRVNIRQAVFLSTPSLRRATQYIPDGHMTLKISIHALLAEGDAVILNQRRDDD